MDENDLITYRSLLANSDDDERALIAQGVH
jgi:hypothetical protein